MRAKGTGALAAGLVIACLLSAAPVRAGDDVAEARADYDAAAAAYDRADYAIAAVRFARADERVPNPRALRLAMASALLVSDAALAMNLVERTEARAASSPLEPAVVELARKLRARFEPSVGRLHLSCAADAPCRPSVDGDAVDPARGRWVSPGKHLVSFETGAVPITREVLVRAGDRLDVPMGVANEAPPPPAAAARPADPAAPPHASAGLAPAFFWTGVAVTGVAVATASVLTVVVANRHDDFVAQPSAATASAGDAAQTRARVAWVVSGAFAVGTAVVGLLTDFGGPSRASAQVTRPASRCTLAVGPLAAGVTGTFW